MKILFTLILIFTAVTLNAKSYMFFLHNRFLEEQGLEGVHPEYGKVEYNEILTKFKNAGFEVVSEIRPKDADVQEYVAKVSAQIKELIALGVKPSDIIVVGTSKGGYIAKGVSAFLKNKYVNFVFIGCCNQEGSTNKVEYYGNILSIYDISDEIGTSCLMNKEQFQKKNMPHSKEIKLKTGLKHGFLFKALPEWIKPTINWSKFRH